MTGRSIEDPERDDRRGERAGAAIPWLLALALTVASGLLYGLAFPPFAAAPVAWVALAPLFVGLYRASWRRALGLGWVWSLLAAWSVGEWMPAAVETYYKQPLEVGVLVFLLIATVMVAPYHMAFALVCPRLAEYRAPVPERAAASLRVVSPILVAAAWTGAELLRGRLFTGTPLFIGNPWALLGYSQLDVLPLLQVADLAGVYGVTFPVAAFNAGLALSWLSRRGGRPLREATLTLLVSTLPAIGAVCYGALVLTGFGAPEPGAPVRVAAVQGNVDVGTVWSRKHYGANLEIYLDLTRELAESPDPPEIIVWPESAATFFLDEEPRYRARIAQTFSSPTELLIGTPRSSVKGGPPYFNSVYLLTHEGRLAGRYDKQLLVPFAEYFPLGGIEFLKRRFEGVNEFARGPASAALATRAGPAGVLICNEAMLPEIASKRVAVGASWLVSPSNDRWVPNRDFAELQFDIVALRAVEQRRFLVRASTSGPSAIIDPYGRILARTNPMTRATVTAEIRPIEGRTVYSAVGDLFGFGCLALAAVGAVTSRRLN